jgi:hypothetical protein
MGAVINNGIKGSNRGLQRKTNSDIKSINAALDLILVHQRYRDDITTFNRTVFFGEMELLLPWLVEDCANIHSCSGTTHFC